MTWDRQLRATESLLHVWCGLMKDKVIICSYFFAENTVTGIMLTEYALPQFPDGIILQQDSAPCHHALVVQDILAETLLGCLTGRQAELIVWPLRSPDITPLDFFLWGFGKTQVYQTPVDGLSDLRRSIHSVIVNITLVMMSNTWQEIEYKLDKCHATNGVHFEVG